MTSKQIELVQTSFKTVQTISEEAARLFYRRLFEIDSSLRPMFRGDLEEQWRKLMQMLGAAVDSLNKFEEVVPAIESLGKRHASYGVRDEHYDTVAAALLWTLERGLGLAFTREVAEAWVAMYEVVTAAMKHGAATLPTAV
jgi:hemoglobin-like flavoprotein